MILVVLAEAAIMGLIYVTLAYLGVLDRWFPPDDIRDE